MVELIHSFRLPVPLARAWAALDDPDLVAAAYPGASVADRDHDTLHGRLDVKIGPTVVSYDGTAQVTWRDQPARRFVIEVSGAEVGASGTLVANVNATLREAPSDAEATEVELRTVLEVTGRVAQFGEGILDEVFGRQLQGMATALIAAGLPETAAPLPPPSEPEPEPEPEVDDAAPALDVAPGSGADQDRGDDLEQEREERFEPETPFAHAGEPRSEVLTWSGRPGRSGSPPPPPPPSTAAPATPGAEAGVGEQGDGAGAPEATDDEPGDRPPALEGLGSEDPAARPPVLRPDRPSATARVRNLAERAPRAPVAPPSRPPAAVPPGLSSWAPVEPPVVEDAPSVAAEVPPPPPPPPPPPAVAPPPAAPAPTARTATPAPVPPAPVPPKVVLAPKPAPEPEDESTLVSKAAPYAVLLLILWILRRLLGSGDG